MTVISLHLQPVVDMQAGVEGPGPPKVSYRQLYKLADGLGM
ncbi:MAG: hypothetical protein R3C24_00825 [Cyanobacteriota/Melainabacteria group bacterium]